MSVLTVQKTGVPRWQSFGRRQTTANSSGALNSAYSKWAPIGDVNETFPLSREVT